MSHSAKMVNDRTMDRTWIVVGDGGAARIMAVSPDHTHLVTLQEITAPDSHRKTHDIVSDRGGRSFESGSSTRHGIEAKTDPHELAKERFVRDLGVTLSRNRAAGDFDVLVVVMTRAQMHALRESLDEATTACVAGFLTKDLVKMDNTAVWAHLTEEGLMPAARRPR